MSRKKKIILCSKCEGEGTITTPGSLYDYHKGLYHEPTIKDCSKCNGHGRLLQVTTIKLKKLEG